MQKIACDYALRGRSFSFVKDPFVYPMKESLRSFEDGALLIKNGKIAAFGQASEFDLDPKIIKTIPNNCFIAPGFIDSHVHYPQTPMIGSYGEELLQWLEKYAFPTEQAFNQADYAQPIAELFINQLKSNGVTAAAVYGASFAESAEAFFTAAQKSKLRFYSGVVWMDRNGPNPLLMKAEKSYALSKTLIKKWHNKGRLRYAVTPRFAPSCTEEALELAAELFKSDKNLLLQSHLSENKEECVWVKQLFPKSKNYTDVYSKFGLLGRGAVYGHGIHLQEEEYALLHTTHTAIAHCPTSNAFLGSGAFNLFKAKQSERSVLTGLGSDIGAGTSLSPWRTMLSAYETARVWQQSLNSLKAFYLATLGAAESLNINQLTGSFEEGKEADIAVFDTKANPLLALRCSQAQSLEEVLFACMVLADAGATNRLYAQGELVYQKKEEANLN